MFLILSQVNIVLIVAYRLLIHFLQSGQFLGARGDFVPEQICRKLCLLHDQVPPMPAERARAVIEAELGGVPVEDVFEWIDLEKPLGSASIAQVHKAKLRAPPKKKKSRGWSPLNLVPFIPKGSSTEEDSSSSRTASSLSDKETSVVTSGRLSVKTASDFLTPIDRPPVDLEQAWSEAPKSGIVAVKVGSDIVLHLSSVRDFFC